ncbi:deaminase [Pseudomonas pseudonitroreducens]|uniref:deaminase n=1 Tax=Pseudomonas pseudonitroreducens TaxID=2892326 RepID=UPI001F324412|nr:deaminase [Pseudomonas pseudonitroreducens]
MEKLYSREELMNLAIEEQEKCSSYPKVGAVIAKEGKILSKAHRGEIPGKHAERIAIEQLSPWELEGSILFTTLEPCVEMHEGQPEKSCSELIIASRICEVVIGVLDPNGNVYCQGYEALLQDNIKVSFFSHRPERNNRTKYF